MYIIYSWFLIIFITLTIPPLQVVSQDGKSMEVKAPIHVASSNGVEFLNTLNELLKSQDLSLNIANSEGELGRSYSTVILVIGWFFFKSQNVLKSYTYD